MQRTPKVGLDGRRLGFWSGFVVIYSIGFVKSQRKKATLENRFFRTPFDSGVSRIVAYHARGAQKPRKT